MGIIGLTFMDIVDSIKKAYHVKEMAMVITVMMSLESLSPLDMPQYNFVA